MAVDFDAYETVVGLEVHAQLLTQSKLFCGDSTAFGSEPNTQVSPITLAHPGTLPKMNKKAIEFAIKMGLACHCEIVKENYFARKNYFYPDLPKGYQLSQHTTPICKGGYLTIKINDQEKNICLNRIHIEEDAGKSLHDVDPEYTSIDFNRAGVPLIEIVSEPDIRSGDEASAYLTELRKLVRYLEICDGNMEEGSLRCDANVSVRKRGEQKLGTKAEIKNLNSIRNVKRAIEFESRRMMEMLAQGLEITQQTRSFDADSGTTFSIRDKEDAEDYRYFPDPDLTKFSLTDEFIENIRKTIPVLQKERIKKYTSEYQLSYYDASLLTEEKKFSDYFEQMINNLPPPLDGARGRPFKPAANWMLGPVRSWLNDNNLEIDEFPLAPTKIAGIIELIEEGKLSFSVASSKLFHEIIKSPKSDPGKIAEQKNWMQDSDTDHIENLIDQVLNKFPEKVKEYKKGKKGLIGLFVGEVMKLSKGKADPKITNDILSEKLNS
ncbi:MAG: Asp-tRNA(Asn)/Glu-tRNA(Gln) amidotransferase subunit GatB [Bacteroidetes bacterium]|nr:MAG: Asp-tRNA(Asn)/Glu-tRNA(Gln) amidotransferase subunit GatB [Bacteroidota bacterium]